MPTYLLEDRSTVPDDGQADPTIARATKLDNALERARELAKDAARIHGRGVGIIYVYEEGTQNVWSVQYHPEPGDEEQVQELDDDMRPILDDQGEVVTKSRRAYPVGWRIIHDSSAREPEWGTDDQGREVVVDETWTGGIEVTDYDEEGQQIPVNDQATGTTRGVSHVEVTRG